MIFFWKLVMSRIFRKSLGKFGKKLFHQKNQKTLKFYSIWKKFEPNCSEKPNTTIWKFKQDTRGGTNIEKMGLI